MPQPSVNVPCSIIPGPAGDLCRAVQGQGTGGGLIGFFLHPVPYLDALAKGFLSSVESFLGTSTLINISQPAEILIYGKVAAVAFVVAVFMVIGSIGFRRDTLAKLWAFPGFALFLLSLGIVPALVIVLNDAVDSASAGFAGGTSKGVQNLFDGMNQGLFGGSVKDVLFPAGGVVVSGVVGLLFLVAAAVLWLELFLRVALVMVLVVFYPLYAIYWIAPGRDGNGRQHLNKFLDILVATLLSKLVVVIVLALAAAFYSEGSAQAEGVALALFLISVVAPFAFITYLPLVSIASGSATLRGHVSRPAASAGRRVARFIK